MTRPWEVPDGEIPVRAAPPATRFGPYRLVELLGRGGMGEVYRAEHMDQRRMVAIKLLLPAIADDPGFEKRFVREAQLAARLHDPHVVPVHAWGRIDGRLYLDMRLVEGVDLRHHLDAGGPFAPQRAVGVVAQVASALDAAHRAGLVHRDVKPSNVLLCPDEWGDEFAYLADFGIARPLSGGEVTDRGAAVGSAHYMAPERFRGLPVDGRADVYALGCLLHETLTGECPFPVGGIIPLMAAHLLEQPPRPSDLAPVPPALDAVVARAMAKEPSDRFPTAGALAAAARVALAVPAPRALPRPVRAAGCAGPRDRAATRPDRRVTHVPRPAPRPAATAGAARPVRVAASREGLRRWGNAPGRHGRWTAGAVAVAALLVAVLAVALLLHVPPVP